MLRTKARKATHEGDEKRVLRCSHAHGGEYMRILSLQYSAFPDDSAGVYNTVYNLYRPLAGKGHQLHLIVARIREDLPERETLNGMNFYRISGFKKSSPLAKLIAMVLDIRKVTLSILKREGVDIIHIHNPLMGVGTYLVLQSWRIPRVYHFHSSWFQEERKEYLHTRGIEKPPLGFTLRLWLMRALEYLLLSRVQRIIVLSEYSRDLVVRVFGISQEKIVKIEGGVDSTLFSPAKDRKKVRELLALPQDKMILFTVRALIARTGIEELIEAFSQVVKVRRDSFLVIGGRGRLRAQIERMVDERELSDAVRIVGFIPYETLPYYYQAADIFVLPTQEQEGFGLVTVEALASGIPVLGTPVGGTIEILAHLDERLLFEGTSPHAIAKGIIFWMEHRERLETIKKHCREYVVSKYSWDVASQNLEKVWYSLMEDR